MTDTADYQRGYAAGRRRAKHDDEALTRHVSRMALAAAIAPEVIRSPWQSTSAGGVKTTLNTAEGMAGTIASLVKAIERKL